MELKEAEEYARLLDATAPMVPPETPPITRRTIPYPKPKNPSRHTSLLSDVLLAGFRQVDSLGSRLGGRSTTGLAVRDGAVGGRGVRETACRHRPDGM